jgi:hypothetical protein
MTSTVHEVGVAIVGGGASGWFVAWWTLRRGVAQQRTVHRAQIAADVAEQLQSALDDLASALRARPGGQVDEPRAVAARERLEDLVKTKAAWFDQQPVRALLRLAFTFSWEVIDGWIPRLDDPGPRVTLTTEQCEQRDRDRVRASHWFWNLSTAVEHWRRTGRLPKKMADDLFEAEVIWEYGRDCCDPRKAA